MNQLFTPVRTKCEFVRRYSKGEFGNASPTWKNLNEFLTCKSRWDKKSKGYKEKLYHIRNGVRAGKTAYNVLGCDVPNEWVSIVRSGEKETNLYISEMCPTEKTLFQGEVSEMDREPFSGGLDLTYTQVALPMREALEQSANHIHGIAALETLRHYLCSNSFAWLKVLLERYPGHVIEFSTFSVQWGTLEGYNTVFWEVREY